jgi:preprotein translocase subunit SecG
VYTLLTVLHVIVCIFLILVVLLQAGKGGGMGLAFGGSGGSQSVFGSSGGANLLTRATAIAAFIFFTNSLALAYLSSQSDSSRMKKVAEKKANDLKAQEAAGSKMLTEIEKQRAENEKAKLAASPDTGTVEDPTVGQAPAALPEEKAKTETAATKPAPAAKPVGEKPVVEKKPVAAPKPAKKVVADETETKPAKAEKAEKTEKAEDQPATP